LMRDCRHERSDHRAGGRSGDCHIDHGLFLSRRPHADSRDTPHASGRPVHAEIFSTGLYFATRLSHR
jgi:hypothetical protein